MIIFHFDFELFQSHAGSIEAPPRPPGLRRARRFQSHAGSIEAPGRRALEGGNFEFQSHAGSIEAGPTDGPPHPPGRVSIPRWFD